MSMVTAVWRVPGKSSPWHLPHPTEAGLTLCGTRRGSIASSTEWGAGDGLDFQCRRCARLLEAGARYSCLECERRADG